MAGEWQATTLQEFCRKPNGGIQTGPFGSQLHRSDYNEIGVPVIMPTNIQNGRLSEDGIARVSEAMADQLRRHRVRLGDIIFSRRGEVDKCAVVTDREVNWLCGTGCLLARVDPKIADPRYIGYHISLPETREWLRQNAVGLVMPNLNTGILERIPIHAPDRQEQLAIADLLASLDAKIDLNRQMAATLEDMARALFKSWFVDFAPVHAKAGGRDTGLPADITALLPDGFDNEGLPKGWVWKRADAIARSVRSTADPKAMPPETPYVGLEHLPRKSLGMSSHGHAHEVESGKLYFKAGDLLFGKLRPYFHKVSIMPFEGIASSDIFVFRAKSEKYRALMYFGFSEEKFVASASGASTGTRMPRADWSYMSEQQFASDDGKVLEAFNEIALSHATQISERLAECQKLEQLRDALLPKLLSGELRVDGAADSIAAA